MYLVHYAYTGEDVCLEIKIRPSVDYSVLLLITGIS